MRTIIVKLTVFLIAITGLTQASNSTDNIHRVGIGIAGITLTAAQAEEALIYGPAGMAFDDAGNLYFADRLNHRICKVEKKNGKLTTVAGTGEAGNSGDNGSATNAQLNAPMDVAIQGSKLFIADMLNDRIRVVNIKTGIINSIPPLKIGSKASNAAASGGSVPLMQPKSIALSNGSALYVADQHTNAIVRIDLQTFAAQRIPITNNSSTKNKTKSNRFSPFDLDSDAEGNIFFSDYYNGEIGRLDRATKEISKIQPKHLDRKTGKISYYKLKSPQGLTISNNNKITIIQSGREQLTTLNAQTGKIVEIRPYGVRPNHVKRRHTLNPSHLATSKDGTIWVSRYLDHQITTLSTFTPGSSKTVDNTHLLSLAKKTFRPITEYTAESRQESDMIALGRALFFDPRLSASGTIACVTCHNLNNKYGADGKNLPTGENGHKGVFNTPTVLNAALQNHLMYDASTTSLAEQAKGVLFSFREMANPNSDELEKRLNAVAAYRSTFQNVFNNGVTSTELPVTLERVTTALAAFQRTLITPSAFDQYLLGNENALSAKQIRGLKHFLATGCAGCHNGAALGGKRLRTQNPILRMRYPIQSALGPSMTVKVPQLRNVLKTDPYLHRGNFEHIRGALEFQQRFYTLEYQDQKVEVNLSKQQLNEIEAFFGALTGTAYVN